MFSVTRFSFFILAAALLSACGSGAKSDSNGAAALTTAAKGWETAYNAKDATALAAVYSEDAQLLPPGTAAVDGRPAIQDYWTNDINSAWGQTTVSAQSTEIAGDWAWRSGTWSATTSPPVSGKFVEIWHMTASGWKLHRDIWNVDEQPAAAPPAAAPPPT
jgi:ketosteroid isomerase-like protein